MNKQEAAIVSAYTGIMIGEFDWMHEYVEHLFGRPVSTHEFGDHAFMEQVKNAAKHDFCNISMDGDMGTLKKWIIANSSARCKADANTHDPVGFARSFGYHEGMMAVYDHLVGLEAEQ